MNESSDLFTIFIVIVAILVSLFLFSALLPIAWFCIKSVVAFGYGIGTHIVSVAKSWIG